MITKEDALETAKKELVKIQSGSNVELMIMADQILESNLLWIFFYNSKQFILTSDEKYLIGGNAPILIDKLKGKCHKSGTAMPIEFYINQVEKEIAS